MTIAGLLGRGGGELWSDDGGTTIFASILGQNF